MRANLVMTSLRVLTWCCVIVLAILSLLPDQQMMRTGLPGRVEHFRRLRWVGCDRGGRVRRDPWRHADYWRLLGVRRCPGIPPALLARPPPGNRGFRGVSAGRAVWRARYRPTLAAAGGLGAVEGSPPGGLLRPFQEEGY